MNDRLQIASEQLAALIMADRLNFLHGRPFEYMPPSVTEARRRAEILAQHAFALADALLAEGERAKGHP
jgi:hypothetical protein